MQFTYALTVLGLVAASVNAQAGNAAYELVQKRVPHGTEDHEDGEMESTMVMTATATDASAMATMTDHAGMDMGSSVSSAVSSASTAASAAISSATSSAASAAGSAASSAAAAQGSSGAAREFQAAGSVMGLVVAAAGVVLFL